MCNGLRFIFYFKKQKTKLKNWLNLGLLDGVGNPIFNLTSYILLTHQFYKFSSSINLFYTQKLEKFKIHFLIVKADRKK